MADIFFSPPEYIRSATDLPPAVAGVHTIPAGKSLFFVGVIDLLGNRLAFSGIASLAGNSSNTSIIRSTGLANGVPLITTSSNFSIQNISIDKIHTAFAINGSGVAALDWQAFNILGCTNIGAVQNVASLTVANSFWGASLDNTIIGSQGLVISGTINVLNISYSRFVGASGAIITFGATAAIANRVRITFSSLSAPLGASALTFVAGFTVPNDMIVLYDVAFVGSTTTPIVGVTAFDNRARWAQCRGIENDSNSSYWAMTANAVTTNILVANTFYKIAGVTTTVSSQRFSNSGTNRDTYTGIVSRSFIIQAYISLIAGNNNQLKIHIRVYTSANVLKFTSREVTATASGAGRLENAAITAIASFNAGDYYEVWITNSATGNITVSNMIVCTSNTN